jgi:hypothetical protein
MESAVDIIGWAGMIVLVSAYLLVSNNKIDAQTKTYQGLNIFASTCLIINTGYYGAYPAMTLNVVWVLMGLFFLTKFILNSRDKTQ